MQFRVLGPLEVEVSEGRVLRPAGRKQRLLLAALARDAPRVVSTDRLIDLLWPDRLPSDPAGALQTQVSRLRALLRGGGAAAAPVRSEPYGYRLAVAEECVDAACFAAGVEGALGAATPERALALLDGAIELWRGPPFEEFADLPTFLGEAVRLEDLRRAALERRAECLLALGRAVDALAAAELLGRDDPLYEKACALRMEALYRSGRQRDALGAYDEYRRALGDELGLDPSPALRRLKLEILRHELATAPPRDGPAHSHRTRSGDAAEGDAPGPALRLAFLERDGGRVAYAEAGDGACLFVPPAWCSNLAAIGAGSDPRSAVLGRLASRFRLLLYDRLGTGLSAGQCGDLSLDSDVDEAAGVLAAAGAEPVTVLAVSQAGPVALMLAARHPERIAKLVLFGTYASGPRAFPRAAVRDSMVALVRAHWGIGSQVLLADLLYPGAGAADREAYARAQRESAPPELAARALERIYAADVSALLPRIEQPTLVIHYTGDRAIPFAAARDLCAHLPNARLVPLAGIAHLPHGDDVARVCDVIQEFAAS